MKWLWRLWSRLVELEQRTALRSGLTLDRK